MSGGAIYGNRDEALRQGLIKSWRYHRRRYSTLRIELRDQADKRPDTEPTPPVEDVIAASEELEDNDQHSEPGAAGQGDMAYRRLGLPFAAGTTWLARWRDLVRATPIVMPDRCWKI